MSEPSVPIKRLSLLSPSEYRQIVVEWNATEADYPRESTVHELFEAQADNNPDAIALVHEDHTLSYGELNARANRLARHLRHLGVAPETLVAIRLERSMELVAAQLAVLKCGAAYVPLDSTFPDERQVFMAHDCEARAIVTTKEAKLAEALTAPRLFIDDPKLSERPSGNLSLALNSEMAAYVMYTSGSTGKPKGVVIRHRGITRLVINCGYADFRADDGVALAANPAFDAATMEVWAPLLNGGRIVVIDQDTLLEPARFAEALKRHQVSVLWMTAGHFHQCAQSLGSAIGSLRYLMVGGDALDARVIARTLRENAPRHLLNGYGPTETTTFAATHEVKEVADVAKSIPLGRPIGNTRIYILDAHGQPAPIGVAGQICIGGDGLGRGYQKRPDLTAERFVPDPFSQQRGGRIYKTGDVGRWQADGRIEFLGRNVLQVKIRGFRIELGEIEAALTNHERVSEVVAVARDDGDGSKRLVAYYTGEEVEAEALRSHLSRTLPEHMVPVAYVRMEALPLTANGKIERRGLPAPEQEAYVRRGYEEPIGEIETMLARIWGEALKVERVGRRDNFFELGGHSLLMVSLIGKHRQMGLETSIIDLFTHPTIEYLATYLESRKEYPLKRPAAIPFRKDGAQPPLFFVHEGWGEMLYGPRLVFHLAPGFPIYGLATPYSTEKPLRTIQAMAACLAQMIRAVQPHGPYRIIGWSFGATLAYEIATSSSKPTNR